MFPQHKGRQHDESVFANFCQYKLDSQYLDVVVADASLPLWRDRLLVDAIITDRKLCFFSIAFGRGIKLIICYEIMTQINWSLLLLEILGRGKMMALCTYDRKKK